MSLSLGVGVGGWWIDVRVRWVGWYVRTHTNINTNTHNQNAPDEHGAVHVPAGHVGEHALEGVDHPVEMRGEHRIGPGQQRGLHDAVHDVDPRLDLFLSDVDGLFPKNGGGEEAGPVGGVAVAEVGGGRRGVEHGGEGAVVLFVVGGCVWGEGDEVMVVVMGMESSGTHPQPPPGRRDDDPRLEQVPCLGVMYVCRESADFF